MVFDYIYKGEKTQNKKQYEDETSVTRNSCFL